MDYFGFADLVLCIDALMPLWCWFELFYVTGVIKNRLKRAGAFCVGVL